MRSLLIRKLNSVADHGDVGNAFVLRLLAGKPAMSAMKTAMLVDLLRQADSFNPGDANNE